MKAFIFGEIIWDHYPDAAYIGGASLNFAAHIAKLGAKAYLCSAVGEDQIGKKTIKVVKEFGIKESYVFSNSKSTGSCTVKLDENKKPTFDLYMDSAYDYIEISDKELKAIEKLKCDMLYFGTTIQRAETSQETLHKILNKCSFPEVFCDINMRKNCWTLETVKYCFDKSTLLKLSRDEEQELINLGFLADTEVSQFSERYKIIGENICKKHPQIKIVLITLDEDGAVAYESKTQTCIYMPPIKVNVCSTVGAGDSFSAAFVCEYFKGETLKKCLEKAVQLSSYVVSKKDAVPQYTEKIFTENN